MPENDAPQEETDPEIETIKRQLLFAKEVLSPEFYQNFLAEIRAVIEGIMPDHLLEDCDEDNINPP